MGMAKLRDKVALVRGGSNITIDLRFHRRKSIRSVSNFIAAYINTAYS